jgi:allophycocyanin beta subunit
MMDAIARIISDADAQGQHLDQNALAILKTYIATGELRVRAAGVISANADQIIKKAVAKSLLDTEVTRPGGNMYTTRRHAACIRDLEYFLRYATYAMLAGDTSILDERVLKGLKETYNSLGVPIPFTVKAIRAMKEVATELMGTDAGEELGTYLDYICDALSDADTIAAAMPSQSPPDVVAYAPRQGEKVVEQGKEFKVILRNDLGHDYLELSVDDVWGLIVGDAEILDRLEIASERGKYLNKSLLVSYLGDLAREGSEEANKLLEELLFRDFPDGCEWDSNNFKVVDTAAWQIREIFPRAKTIEIFLRAMKEGNYAAKVASITQAGYMVEEVFVQPMRDITRSTNDDFLKKWAETELQFTEARLHQGLGEIDFEKELEQIPEFSIY